MACAVEASQKHLFVRHAGDRAPAGTPNPRGQLRPSHYPVSSGIARVQGVRNKLFIMKKDFLNLATLVGFVTQRYVFLCLLIQRIAIHPTTKSAGNQFHDAA
jgi:hypothetical protein